MTDKTKICRNDADEIAEQAAGDEAAGGGRKRRIGRAFKAAFPHTIPIFAGFLFIGLAYGIYINMLS